MSELAVQEELLLDPRTGELHPVTPVAAITLLHELREYKTKVLAAIRLCEEALIGESARVGTKTLRIGALTAEITGGMETVWDVEELRRGLADAGLPEERVTDLIRATVEYRVDGRVAKQIAGANEEYAAVLERCRRLVDKPMRVSVK